MTNPSGDVTKKVFLAFDLEIHLELIISSHCQMILVGPLHVSS